MFTILFVCHTGGQEEDGSNPKLVKYVSSGPDFTSTGGSGLFSLCIHKMTLDYSKDLK